MHREASTCEKKELTVSCSRTLALALKALCAILFCSRLRSCFAAGSKPSLLATTGFLLAILLSKLVLLSLNAVPPS